jgi:hypothetical protein
MIKKDENGIVVEFEDDAAVAAMAAPPATKAPRKGQASPKPGATREDLEQIFNEEVAVIIAKTDAELRGYVAEATAKVAQIEKDCAIAKEELRKALQSGINETNRICREAIVVLKADNDVALAAVRQSRYDALSPLQVEYDLKLADLKARQDAESTAARVRLSEGLSHLKSEKASDDKLAAVVAEAPQASPNPNETLDP